MIRHIRPHKIFNAVKTKTYYERLIHIVLPDHRTEFLLLATILVALTKIVKPKKFFEFGTYIGIQLLNIAVNLGPSSKLYTLDLNKRSLKQMAQHEYDKVISKRYFQYGPRAVFFHSPYNKRIKRLYGNSNEFDFTPFYKKMDMIYIDGGHDIRTVTSDTKNAFQMLPEKSFSCIVWHDYGHPKFPKLAKFLEGLSRRYRIYHVEETRVCFYLKNAPQKLKRSFNTSIRSS